MDSNDNFMLIGPNFSVAKDASLKGYTFQKIIVPNQFFNIHSEPFELHHRRQ